MKSTGVIRRIDGLGRIVLPKEIRDSMLIHNDDPVEILREDDKIILRKYYPAESAITTLENLELYAGNELADVPGAIDKIHELIALLCDSVQK